MEVLTIRNNMENNFVIKFQKCNQKKINKNKIPNKNIKYKEYLVVNTVEKDKLKFNILIEKWGYLIK
jgi:hypothetical protein